MAHIVLNFVKTQLIDKVDFYSVSGILFWVLITLIFFVGITCLSASMGNI